MVPLRVLSRTNLADPSLRAPSNSQSINDLPPLEISCRSFSDRHPLFSILCGLFSKNTRVGGTRARLAFRNALFSLRRLSALSVSALSFRLPICLAGGGTNNETATLTGFRINTCKSVSKQMTLTLFIINTYAKPGGGGRRRRKSVSKGKLKLGWLATA